MPGVMSETWRSPMVQVSKGKLGVLITSLPPARMMDMSKAVGFALNLW